MEQTQANSCANCASIAPAGKIYQRCAGCKQASYCSRDCQKEHWTQHKQGCKLQQRQQQNAPVTSAQTTASGNHDDENEDDEDDSDDETDYSDEDDEDEDEDDEDDEDEDPYPEPKPLAFLRIEPFPHLKLSIDGSPVAIVDAGSFVEETDKKNLTAAHAVSTMLWFWHPNALRAFLDQKTYSEFEFAIVDDSPGRRERTTHMITRHDRAIMIGDYNRDMEWNHQLSYGLLENGHWKPLYGMLGDMGFGSSKPEIIGEVSSMWAKDQMYAKRWKPYENRTFELTLGGGKVDPASLY
jgi:hypothetical protein